VPGTIKVVGVITDRCGSAAPSAEASIAINSLPPTTQVMPPAGFSGITACNVNPIVFTALSNFSAPCTQDYTWTFPASWKFLDPNTNQLRSSPITTSGNTISLTPSGTQADASAIGVAVKYTCGTTLSGSSFTPPFVPPTIYGSTNICTAEQYTISNAPGIPVVWSTNVQNFVTINSSGLATRVASSNGAATIKATFPCNTTHPTKDVWVGLPDPGNNSVVYEQFNYGVNPINLNSGSVFKFCY
jgi:hypothetical protein